MNDIEAEIANTLKEIEELKEEARAIVAICLMFNNSLGDQVRDKASTKQGIVVGLVFIKSPLSL